MWILFVSVESQQTREEEEEEEDDGKKGTTTLRYTGTFFNVHFILPPKSDTCSNCARQFFVRPMCMCHIPSLSSLLTRSTVFVLPMLVLLWLCVSVNYCFFFSAHSPFGFFIFGFFFISLIAHSYDQQFLFIFFCWRMALRSFGGRCVFFFLFALSFDVMSQSSSSCIVVCCFYGLSTRLKHSGQGIFCIPFLGF